MEKLNQEKEGEMKGLKMIPWIVLGIMALVGIAGGIAFVILTFSGFFEPLTAAL